MRDKSYPLHDSWNEEGIFEGTFIWSVDMRCPECEHIFKIEEDEETIHALDEALATQSHSIQYYADKLKKEIDSDWANTFVAALNANAITAFDFSH